MAGFQLTLYGRIWVTPKALAGALTDCSVDATAKGFYFGVSSGYPFLDTVSLTSVHSTSRPTI